MALLTPVVKAALTDLGTEAANNAVQVLGGHGYVHEWGVEQLVRDARIAQIYEGTNGIQALDLVGRKLGQDTGRLLRRFFHPVAAWLEAHGEDEALAAYAGPTAKAFGRLQQATMTVAQRGLSRPEEAAAAATGDASALALRRSVRITNSRGLHARAAAKLVAVTERFSSSVNVSHDGETVPAGSIMGLMMLGAGCGSEITIEADGWDAKEALEAVAGLVEAGFHED